MNYQQIDAEQIRQVKEAEKKYAPKGAPNNNTYSSIGLKRLSNGTYKTAHQGAMAASKRRESRKHDPVYNPQVRSTIPSVQPTQKSDWRKGTNYTPNYVTKDKVEQDDRKFEQMLSGTSKPKPQGVKKPSTRYTNNTATDILDKELPKYDKKYQKDFEEFYLYRHDMSDAIDWDEETQENVPTWKNLQKKMMQKYGWTEDEFNKKYGEYENYENARSVQDGLRAVKQTAEDSPFLSSLYSLPMNLGSALEGIGTAVRGVAGLQDGTLMGKAFDAGIDRIQSASNPYGVNYDEWNQSDTRDKEVIRQTVADQVADSVNGTLTGKAWQALGLDLGSVASGGYNAGMGLGDMGFNMLMSGGNPAAMGVISGLQNARQNELHALERGVDPKKAAKTGLLTGVVAGIMNTAGLDAVLKTTAQSVAGQFLQGAAKEGLENVLEDLGDQVIDNVINDVNSEEAQTIQHYLDQGMSPKEAWQQTIWDYMKQEAISFTSGAALGGVMAAGRGSIPSLITPQPEVQGRVPDVVENARAQAERAQAEVDRLRGEIPEVPETETPEAGRQLSPEEQAIIQQELAEEFERNKTHPDGEPHNPEPAPIENQNGVPKNYRIDTLNGADGKPRYYVKENLDETTTRNAEPGKVYRTEAEAQKALERLTANESVPTETQAAGESAPNDLQNVDFKPSIHNADGKLVDTVKVPEYSADSNVFFNGSDSDIALAEAQDAAITDTFRNIVSDPEFNALSFKNGRQEVYVSPSTSGDGYRISYTVDGVPTGHHDYSLDEIDDLSQNLREMAGNGGEDVRIQRKSDILSQNAAGESAPVEVNPEDVIYHSGKLSRLNKAETYGKMGDGGRDTGYYGTGHYFVDSANKNKIGKGSGYGDKPYTSVDISKYDNLFRADTDAKADNLHDLSQKIMRFVNGYNDHYYTENGNVDGVALRKYLDDAYSVYKELFADKAMSRTDFETKLKQYRAEFKYDLNDMSDSPFTEFMKEHGFNGVDTRGTGSANTGRGVVIYDLDEDSVLQSNVTDQAIKDGLMNTYVRNGDPIFDESRDAELQPRVDASNNAKQIRREYAKLYDETKLKQLEKSISELKEQIDNTENNLLPREREIASAEGGLDAVVENHLREMRRMLPNYSREDAIKYFNSGRLDEYDGLDPVTYYENKLASQKAELAELNQQLATEKQLQNTAKEQARATVEGRTIPGVPEEDIDAAVVADVEAELNNRVPEVVPQESTSAPKAETRAEENAPQDASQRPYKVLKGAELESAKTELADVENKLTELKNKSEQIAEEILNLPDLKKNQKQKSKLFKESKAVDAEIKTLEARKKVLSKQVAGKLVPTKDLLDPQDRASIYDNRSGGINTMISYARKFAGDTPEARELADRARKALYSFVESGSDKDFSDFVDSILDLDELARNTNAEYKTKNGAWTYNSFFGNDQLGGEATLADRVIGESEGFYNKIRKLAESRYETEQPEVEAPRQNEVPTVQKTEQPESQPVPEVTATPKEEAPRAEVPNVKPNEVPAMRPNEVSNVPPTDVGEPTDTTGGRHTKTSEAYTNTGRYGGGWTEEEYGKYTDPSQFQYEDTTEEASVNEGFRMIRDEGFDEFRDRVMGKERLTAAEIDGLMAEWRVICDAARRAEAAGEDASDIWADSIKVFRKVQEQQSNNAQALQAMAKWTRNTAEGLLSRAENIVNGKVKADGEKTALQKQLEKFSKEKKFKFSDEFVVDFLKKAEQLQGLDMDSRQAKDIMADLGRMVNREIPVKFGEKLTTLLMDNMLGNFRTLITRNAGGNLGLNVFEQVLERPLAAGIDMLVAKKTGKRAQAGLSRAAMADYISGFAKGLKDEGHDFKTDLHTARSGENTLENAIKSNRHVFKEKGIMDRLDKMVRHGLSVGDRPFYEAVYKQTLGDYQRLRDGGKMGDVVQKLSDKDFKMYAETAAKMNALAAVYQQDSKLSKAMLNFKESIGQLSEGVLGFDILSQFSMPFVKTPANIVERAVDYSPLGLIRNAARTAREVKAGSFDQNRFVNETARNILGTGLMAGGAALAANGGMSGGYSDDPDEKQAQKESGMQEYAWNVPDWIPALGGMQMDIGWMPVIGSNLEAAAAAYDAYDKGEGNPLSNFATGIGAGTNALFDQSMFQGLQRLFGTANSYDSDKTLAGNLWDVVASGLGQLEPSMLRQLGQVTDEYQRDVGNSNADISFGLLDNYNINSLANNLPIAREYALAPRVDTQGRLVEENQGRNIGMKILEDMILPGKITKVDTNRLSDEAARLSDITKNKDSYMPKASRTAVDTDKHTLSNDEWVRYQQKYYQDMTSAGNKLLDDEYYANADDAKKESMLKSVYSEVRNAINSTYTEVKQDGAAKAYLDAGGGEAGVKAAVDYTITSNKAKDLGLNYNTYVEKERNYPGGAKKYAEDKVKADELGLSVDQYNKKNEDYEGGAEGFVEDQDKARAAGFVTSDNKPNVDAYNKAVEMVGDDPAKIADYRSFKSNGYTKRVDILPALKGMGGFSDDEKGRILDNELSSISQAAEGMRNKYGDKGLYYYYAALDAADANHNNSLTKKEKQDFFDNKSNSLPFLTQEMLDYLYANMK